MPRVTKPANATSRHRIDAPSTSGRSAATPRRRDMQPRWSTPVRRDVPRTAAIAPVHRRTGSSHAGRGAPVTARVPVACELPETSGQRGLVVNANTGTSASAKGAPIPDDAVSAGSQHDHLLRARGSASATG